MAPDELGDADRLPVGVKVWLTLRDGVEDGLGLLGLGVAVEEKLQLRVPDRVPEVDATGLYVQVGVAESLLLRDIERGTVALGVGEWEGGLRVKLSVVERVGSTVGVWDWDSVRVERVPEHECVRVLGLGVRVDETVKEDGVVEAVMVGGEMVGDPVGVRVRDGGVGVSVTEWVLGVGVPVKPWLMVGVGVGVAADGVGVQLNEVTEAVALAVRV